MTGEGRRRPLPRPPICPTCEAYLRARGMTIARAIAERRSEERGAGVIATEFMNGLHQRHTAGLPIGVRP
jgi:hypothetical protein